MRVTALGHAALWLETVDQRVLVDPVLEDGLAGGAVVYSPGRVLDANRMSPPTLIVATHGHFDHFHPLSLRMLQQRWPGVPIVAPHDAELLGKLKAIGFEAVTALAPWEELTIGRTRLRPTPSKHDEPEFGVIVDDGEAVLWHMADGEVGPDVGERVARLHGACGIVSCKYQPVADASVNQLWSLGPTFDAAEVAEWLEAACNTEPAFVFPYASGLCFAGRHAWFNRYAFPFSAREIVGLLRLRLGDPARAGGTEPGDIVECTGRTVRVIQQASPIVKAAPGLETVWEPFDFSTLPGLDNPDIRQQCHAQLESLLSEQFASWLSDELENTWSPIGRHVAAGVVWQLTVHAGDDERWEYAIDFRALPTMLARGRHPDANYLTPVGRSPCRGAGGRGAAQPVLARGRRSHRPEGLDGPGRPDCRTR